MTDTSLSMKTVFQATKSSWLPVGGLALWGVYIVIAFVLPIINRPRPSQDQSKGKDEKQKPKVAESGRAWRPFPWCLAPDWVWFGQGVFLLLIIAIPAMSAICTTIPTLILLQWSYNNISFVRRATDQLVKIKCAASQSVANRIMVDPRNHDYLPWLLFVSVLPPALLYVAWSRHRVHGFELSTMLVYHHFRLGPRFRNFAHHHVLMHKEGHDKKGFFVGPFKLLNQLSGLWTGLFYGTLPFHYGTAHNKIHHRWHNDSTDVHTNIDLDRTVFSSYVLYLPRFFFYWTGISPMVLFLKRKEYGLAKQLGAGMIYYYGVGLMLCLAVDWKFAVAYWLVPMLESLTFLGMIAYIWHAFVEPEDPDNQYINSVTILNGGDNIWNEDFHVVHHHFPQVHWSNAPAYFESNKDKYAAVTATIFKDCEEGNMIHWIFAQDWNTLADHFVDLSEKLSHAQKKELILRRLSYRKLADDDGGEGWNKWGSSAQRNWDAGKKDD